MLTPQQQQQLLLQAQTQGNISSSGSPLLSDTRFRMLLGRSGLTKDGQSTSSDLSQGVGSPLQAASPLSRGTPQDQSQTELMMKVIKTQFDQCMSRACMCLKGLGTVLSSSIHSFSKERDWVVDFLLLLLL
jgi:hypothetical protein